MSFAIPLRYLILFTSEVQLAADQGRASDGYRGLKWWSSPPFDRIVGQRIGSDERLSVLESC